MRIWLISITLLILLLLAVFGGAGWLFYSEAGADWLFARLGVATGMRIESVEGSLIGQLRLQSLQLEQPDRRVACDSVELDSRLSHFYPLQLQIERLQISDLTFAGQASTASSSATEFSWPELPWWAGMLGIELQQLDLADLRIRQGDAEQRLERLSASGRWREGELQLTRLELRTPDLELSGSINAAFTDPALNLELQADNRRPQQSWQRLQLLCDFKESERLLLSGPISLRLADPVGPWLSVAGELALSEEELLFRGMRLESARRKGSLLLSGKLNFSASETGLSSRLQLQELDLQPEVGKPFRLSGELELKGTLENYAGRFQLASRAEQPLAAQLTGNFSGDRQQLQLSELSGDWLQGALSGQLQADWSDGWRVVGQLAGRQLDPAFLNGRLQGTLNLSLQGEVGDRGQGLNGQLSLALDEAFLQQQPLNGRLELQIKEGQFEIAALELHGQGFSLRGQGLLADQLQLSWQVEQLEQLLAGVHGSLHGSGRLSLAAEGIGAEFSSRGAGLQYENLMLENWQLQGEVVGSEKLSLTFNGQQLQQGEGLAFQDVQLTVRGTVPAHVFNFRLGQENSSLRGALSGGWDGAQWQGMIDQLLIEDDRLGIWRTTEPASLQLDPEQLRIGRLLLAGSAGGSLRLHGSYLPSEQQGEGALVWQNFDLSLLNPWLGQLVLTGASSGNIRLQQAPAPHLQGQLSLRGEIKTPRQTFNLSRGDWQADWGAQGLQSQLDLQLADGSRLEAELTGEEQFAMRWPQQLRLQLLADLRELQRVQAWLPPGLNLNGGLKLQSDGFWRAEQTGQLTGQAELQAAQLSWQEDDEQIGIALTRARLLWQWREQLSAELELQIEERGNIDAGIRLPLAAVLPIQIDSHQQLSGELSARLQELGLLSVLFPGKVQDSSGQLKLDLQLGGFWQQPLLQGDVRVFDCQAYLPQPGIQLQEIELQGRFDRQRFSLNRFEVRSGDGSLSGTGELVLADWRPQNYQLELNGRNFQLLNLPDLQAEISPELKIDGDLKQVDIKGHLQVPKLLVSGQKKNALAENSPDLVIVDAPEKISKPLRIQPRIDLQLQLGDQVLLKTAGLDARLEGELRMESTPQQMLAAFGEIRVAKGRYASYGVNLDISRGNLIYNGGPINQPLLDILALRTAGEVKAGVQVTGTPKRPKVKLYSEPPLPETDILSYIVLGRPVGAQGSQSSVLMTAAGALLSQGESVVLQEKLKDKLGLDVLDINAGDGDASSSVITTGKYLNPDLYVSFGYSLFNNSNEVKLRYSLAPRWEVESNFGTESGADLFYKIDIP